MKRISLLPFSIDVTGIRQALKANPQLWDQITLRTKEQDSPHHGLSDIWVRYSDPAAPLTNGEHASVWYPCADVLPVRPIVQEVLARVEGKRLGGVLITRIPAGRECRPHIDYGWHAGYYEKFAVQVESAPGQAFQFDGESLETKPGDVFWFDNSFTHWVTNPTPHERITLIACIRRKEE